MMKKEAIGGQSLFFNVLFVLINLSGLTFLTIGYHDNFEESKWLFAGLGFGLMALSVLGIIVFRGRLLMSMVSRLLVGSLFIVSGLIKANDPLGFSYKLEEYFEDGALAFRIKEWFSAPSFTLEFLIDWALFLSVFICIIEIVLGVLILIGGKVKLVSWLMILMMVFFTFLTWHTANCDPDKKFVDRDTYAISDPLYEIKSQEAKTNPDLKIITKNSTELIVDEKKQPQCVSDCGCFGDAMKGSVGRSLTPKESLWKDIILVYLVLWIFVAQWKILPNSKKENMYVIPVSLILILFFSYIFGWYFPFLFGFTAILGSLWILRSGGKVLGNYFGVTFFSTAISFMLTSYVLMFEPIKDYRPYAVGSNLKHKMNDGIEGKYANLLVYKNLKTGAKKEYDAASKEYIDSKIWEKTKEWKYETIVTKEIIPTKLPSITGQFNPVILFNDISKSEEELPFIKKMLSNALIDGVLLMDIENQQELKVPENEYNVNDYDTSFYKFISKSKILDPSLSEISIKDYLLDEKQIIILFSKNLKEANFAKVDAYKSIFKKAKDKNIPMILICSSNRNDINAWRKKYQFEIPTFMNDETELKAIARSNPSLMVLQKGIVRGKYPHRSLPTYQWLEKHILLK